MSDVLVWIDCEMTGLDLSRDALVEVACIVTDSELNQLDKGQTPETISCSTSRISCFPESQKYSPSSRG